MRALHSLALLMLVGSSAMAQAVPQGQCPKGARYATNGSNLASCIFDAITLPKSPHVGAYCDYLHLGYIGYSWQITPATRNYHCPDGGRYATNGYGVGFCLFDASSAPAWAGAYCDYLNDGYIGYSWLICPPGARLTDNGAGTEFCLFDNLNPPANAQPYCNYLQSGYMGFSFPVAASYSCPAGFRQTTNGADLGFCLVENLTIPASPPVSPYCDYLQSGYIGFSWPQKP
jgi:hypothetical protein